jgi:hypothetical protein
MLNEFNDLELDCMKKVDAYEKCDPLGDFDSP